jgi:L-asparaginase II
MSDPISVLVTRGTTVESVHRVHAVAVTADGGVVEEAGNGRLVTFMRSAAKPLQALPLARAYPRLDDEQLAIACASHLADPDQLRAVEALLHMGGAGEDDLECGPDGEPPARIKHNCSGKHAGMLALCAANGWPMPGYHTPEHPVQRTLLAEVADATRNDPNEIRTGTDGCGVVAFAVSLADMAGAFARLPTRDGGQAVASAMRAHPELIRGHGSPDTVLMLALEGWIAKGGAEAVFCAAAPTGVGIALKVEDGSARAVGPAVAAFLGRLGHDVSVPESEPVRNSRGEHVGDIVPEKR